MRDNEDFHFVISAAGLLLLLIFVIFSIYVISKILRLTLRWLRWGVANSAGEPVTIFICFAIAAYFYPHPLMYLITVTWSVITTFLSYLLSQLQQQLVFFQTSCASSSCLNIALINLATSWNIFLSNVFAQINLARFPLIDAIMFTAMWLGLTEILNQLTSMSKIGHTLNQFFSHVTKSLRAIPPVTRMNVLFLMVLAISAYLSLTAIIAIPSLQETESSGKATAADLQASLQVVIVKDKDFDTRFPSELSSQSRLEKSEIYKATQSPTEDKNKFLAVASLGNDLSRRLGNVERLWLNLRENFRRDQTAAADLSAQIFELNNKGRKGARETQQHLLNIELWYHRWWGQRAGQLTQCKSDFERFGSNLTSQFETIATISSSAYAPTPSERSNPLPIISTEFLNDVSKRVSQTENDALNSCTTRVDSLDIPTREDFGGYLGVFGLAASWLLKTESLPLVLITGLLGFGLLGAACSTVIRNVPVRGRGEPLVPNLTSVVIRGVSAAILIFLAVFGGLAVFTGGNANPNPYVVLFTCLVAAVFSEDAWSWGAQQFRSRLRGGQSPNAPSATASMTTTRRSPRRTP
jgi:hypothetical protein